MERMGFPHYLCGKCGQNSVNLEGFSTFSTDFSTFMCGKGDEKAIVFHIERLLSILTNLHFFGIFLAVFA